MAGYHVENFGCRAQRADGEAIARDLYGRGLTPASDPNDADLLVVNTCSVTAEADRMARAFLRRVHRQNPHARVIVTGCYAQRAPEELARMEGVTAVIGNSHKGLLAEIATSPSLLPVSAITKADKDSKDSTVPIWVDDGFAHSDLANVGLWSSQQTRPNLKVQDGCSNRCSFCIIPTTRGSSRSRSLQIVLSQVLEFVHSGGQELVLSGINLGRWGRDLQPQSRLENLVRAILEQSSLPRLRLSSIEPMDWSTDLLALFAEYGQCGTDHGPRLARHAHLPLQSGSDAILRAMHRRYRPWHYAEKVESIRSLMPDAAIGADVMVGFPGETDAFFRESYDFLSRLPVTYLHLFPFSARPGTKAWHLQQVAAVPSPAIQERMDALRHLAAEKSLAFRQTFVGRKLHCLTLHASQEIAAKGRTEALTDNFLRVELQQSFSSNRPMLARIQCVIPEGLSGQAV
jgi:threonylcarbamoyladenosine tRNA methylthiotransferase MtaB